MNKNKKPDESNSIWDKIQDFLYDGIDYIFMIVVVVIVGLIIYWRLGGLFSDTKLHKDEFVNKKEQTESNIEKSDKEKEENTDKKESESKEKDKTGKIIKISIPKGSASQKVCDILLENGLIDDKSEFSKYVEEKGAEKKLKYGHYEIPEGSSFDEIIEILTK